MKKRREALLGELGQLNKAHISEGVAVLKAYGGAMYPFDLLTYAVLNRSMSLTSGFMTLIRADNYLAATTLVRPQLDNFLRYAAGWLVNDPHEFAMEILRGKQVNRQKTASGCLMTDRFLVDQFKEAGTWLERVYDETSGMIHLSRKHMFMDVTEIDSETGTVGFAISDTHPHVPPEIWEEAIKGFMEITKLVLHRAHSWRCTKEAPPGQEKTEQQTTDR